MANKKVHTDAGDKRAATRTPKILVASSLGPHKDYCLPFLFDVLKSLEGADCCYIALDGLSLPEGQEAPAGVACDSLPPLASGQGGFYRFARVREAARQYFLKGDWEYLFFLDADIIPPVDILPRLLKTLEDGTAHIATGLYCARGYSQPIIYVVTASGQMPASVASGGAILAEQLGGRTALGGYVAGDKTPTSDLMTIQANGMGCMLISRQALEAVPFRPPSYWENNPLANGEDIQFCLDVKAKFGTLALLDLTLTCWHVHVDGKAYRVRFGEPRYGCFFDDAGTGYVTRGHKWPTRQWHRGAPRFPGAQHDGPALTEEEIEDLGPSFYKGMCRRLSMEVKSWQEATQDRS